MSEVKSSIVIDVRFSFFFFLFLLLIFENSSHSKGGLILIRIIVFKHVYSLISYAIMRFIQRSD